MSTTGHLVQFSVMVLLKPFFPMVFHLSKVLDLSDSADRDIAVGHLKKIMDFAAQPLPTTNHSSPTALFEPALYFLSVMRVLHRDLECRQFVVFPYCFGQWRDDYGIVFPNMIGYRIGLPADSGLRHTFLTAVKKAMKEMHSAGVVHLDWYLSNFMWRVRRAICEDHRLRLGAPAAGLADGIHPEQQLQLKNVAFRTANCKSTVLLNDGSGSILANQEIPDRTNDVRNYDIYLMRLLFSNHENPGLKSDSKVKLDYHFTEIILNSSSRLQQQQQLR
eukprot:gene29388-38477_t